MNTAPNTGDCRSINPDELGATIPSPTQQVLDRVNLRLSYMIGPGMMMNAKRQNFTPNDTQTQ
jgi:hypothetical protein